MGENPLNQNGAFLIREKDIVSSLLKGKAVITGLDVANQVEEKRNLVHENEGSHIILKQSNSKIKKDKFSAFIYGLYYCKLAEDKNARRKKRNIGDYMFYN